MRDNFRIYIRETGVKRPETYDFHQLSSARSFLTGNVSHQEKFWKDMGVHTEVEVDEKRDSAKMIAHSKMGDKVITWHIVKRNGNFEGAVV